MNLRNNLIHKTVLIIKYSLPHFKNNHNQSYKMCTIIMFMSHENNIILICKLHLQNITLQLKYNNTIYS